MSDRPGGEAAASPFVLASASPRRAEILRMLGFEPRVRPAHIDETVLPGEDPLEHVRRLAEEKARAVAAGAEGAQVQQIANQLVFEGNINEARARELLSV